MAKKNFPLVTHQQKIALIEKSEKVPVSRQAQLLGVSRSSVYYAPRVNYVDIRITHALDALYTKRPYYGSRRLKFALEDDYGIAICREHVQRLLRLMGIEAIYPKHRTTLAAPGHRIYPYLLRQVAIVRPNQVWSTDITYIPLTDGFCYLTVILDWYSRYVLSWELSETMETDFCSRALKSALARAIPEIHNSDQGSQYTSLEYTRLLSAKNIQISMDGRARYLDNIFTERLWRSVKYEDIYLKHYATFTETYEGLSLYFTFYNEERRHQALGYQTPKTMYSG